MDTQLLDRAASSKALRVTVLKRTRRKPALARIVLSAHIRQRHSYNALQGLLDVQRIWFITRIPYCAFCRSRAAVGTCCCLVYEKLLVLPCYWLVDMILLALRCGSKTTGTPRLQRAHVAGAVHEAFPRVQSFC